MGNLFTTPLSEDTLNQQTQKSKIIGIDQFAILKALTNYNVENCPNVKCKVKTYDISPETQTKILQFIVYSHQTKYKITLTTDMLTIKSIGGKPIPDYLFNLKNCITCPTDDEFIINMCFIFVQHYWNKQYCEYFDITSENDPYKYKFSNYFKKNIHKQDLKNWDTFLIALNPILYNRIDGELPYCKRFSQNEKWKLNMMKNSNINDFENIVWIHQYEYKLLLHIKNTKLL
tara:strand:- start:8638 stop:9330 length:693 start_codon:yes stop_codon:yes gene_type:complete